MIATAPLIPLAMPKMELAPFCLIELHGSSKQPVANPEFDEIEFLVGTELSEFHARARTHQRQASISSRCQMSGQPR